MKNIFSQTKDYVQLPKRNTFDLSFTNHSTFNFGTLYPVFCKEVLPGDSFSIDTSFALRFMPTAFPVQTKINANLHFFYVRNRNLWNNWQKFIGHTCDSGEFPYIDTSKTEVTTRGLADYLGIPTTLVGSYGQDISYGGLIQYSTQSDDLGQIPYYISPNDISTEESFLLKDSFDSSSSAGFVSVGTAKSSVLSPIKAPFDNNFLISTITEVDGKNVSKYFWLFICDGKPYLNRSVIAACRCELLVNDFSPEVQSYKFNIVSAKLYKYFSFPFVEYSSLTDSQIYDQFIKGVNERLNYSGLGFSLMFSSVGYETPSKPSFIASRGVSSPTSGSGYYGGFTFRKTIDEPYTDLSDVDSSLNPFVITNSSSVRLSALPFRAYESIYNAFYRNEMNDPFMINGAPEYDKYIANDGSGLDTFEYKLHQRNWELDFLTSAVQSPQQGIAPLVGVSMNGDMTFVNKDSNGNVGYFGAKAVISSSGEITGFKLSENVKLNGEVYTDTTDVPDDVKRGTIYGLNQMALAGISINDFRNVNSLQRWLETNIRRGYKYVDQIKSHFGVDVAYNVLDMPEFIGGISEPVYSTQVNQTSETESDPLGSYAGQLSLIASNEHTIKHYCDEHGFIIGIMSITPVPCYSQLLPKHFLKNNYLDYYFPEFAHIGMQPIDYREVAPVQVYSSDPTKLNNTFGYQRPWYDYIASVDEVHGLFRTNLRNFVLNRQFDTFPALNKDFLQVDSEQLNDIFTVQDTSDKILGQLVFKVFAKRPIPMYGVPRLE
ncbi:major capsid protein [Sigmofec virus UA08Rod_4687]|uniref:Major capsid protein n=1 Tax=Sigmofec virus UA08Rod_4687 TaxID=2929407 RepID=A0A976N227_9VIRU|nr:major capsid protein [Sigmofec virus UA08Rod_4687]